MIANDKYLFRASLLAFLVSITFYYSCQKDSDTPMIVPQVQERVLEITGLKGGLGDYKEIYSYDGNRLSGYYTYLNTPNDELKEWMRFSFEYPAENMIIETREGVSDSVWYFTNKYERWLSGDHLEEIIFYDYDEGYPDHWRPIKNIIWTYEEDRLLERMTYKYSEVDWTEYSKAEYGYTGSLWTELTSYKYNGEQWDTLACMILIYQNAHLAKVNEYECHDPGVWILNEQYLLGYEGNRLAEMIINESSGDTLEWDRTLSVTYDQYGHPESYKTTYACCPPEEIIISYEEGTGNLRQATQGVSNYMNWPWFPAPVKKK